MNEFTKLFPISSEQEIKINILVDQQIQEADLELMRQLFNKIKDFTSNMNDLTIAESIHFTLIYIEKLERFSIEKLENLNNINNTNPDMESNKTI